MKKCSGKATVQVRRKSDHERKGDSYLKVRLEGPKGLVIWGTRLLEKAVKSGKADFNCEPSELMGSRNDRFYHRYIEIMKPKNDKE